MNKSAGKLDQAFVEKVFGLSSLCEPEFLEDFVSFEKELPVKTLEVA
jgi:hypothetical protein